MRVDTNLQRSRATSSVELGLVGPLCYYISSIDNTGI